MEKNSTKKAVKRKRTQAPIGSTDSADLYIEQLQNNDEDRIEASPNVNGDNLSNDDWSSSDDEQLMQIIKSKINPNDKVNYRTRLKRINWNEVAFKSYTAKDCEERFRSQLKHVRRQRNLNEIVTDIETYVKERDQKKPLSSYQLFVKEKFARFKSDEKFSEKIKKFSTQYNELSSEAMLPYIQKAEQLRSEYNQKKENSNSVNVPKNDKPTPFQLYAESRKSEGESYKTSRQNYANLSRDDKFEWIIKAVNKSRNGTENVLSILSKEEQRIYNGEVKSTPTSYALYVKDKLEGGQLTKSAIPEIGLQWRSIDPKKKEVYRKAAAILKEKAIEEQKVFNERHGIVVPQKVKRRRATVVERPLGDDHAEMTSEPEPKKKRRSSLSNAHAFDSFETNAEQIQQNPSPKFTLHDEVMTEEGKKLNTIPGECNSMDGNDGSARSVQANPKTEGRKDEKSKNAKPEEPPMDLFSYFAKYIHTGKSRKAIKKFGKLTTEELKQFKAGFNAMLGRYIATLSNEEAVAYVTKIEANQGVENDIDDDSTNGKSPQATVKEKAIEELNEHHGIDESLSSASVSPKKEATKVEHPGNKPPPDVFSYFVKHIYEGIRHSETSIWHRYQKTREMLLLRVLKQTRVSKLAIREKVHRTRINQTIR
ncbi:nucleolar transcription factor 1-B-like isoform X2 [Contarinia nasturtii]|uniref:nucleolar transcription factor 1-B-like isoform X2 n=1 Tax=Contarinia nasturtii TaxID=265458 RepID=UPI0012D4AC61|nr:nucleolar transcription factor 1-B-like isoform X2 [Contarinia nasturtii]